MHQAPLDSRQVAEERTTGANRVFAHVFNAYDPCAKFGKKTRTEDRGFV
jgi:hypothetical protein